MPPLLTASYGSCAGATFCEWESNLLFDPFNYTLVILNPHKAATQAVVTGLSADGGLLVLSSRYLELTPSHMWYSPQQSRTFPLFLGWSRRRHISDLAAECTDPLNFHNEAYDLGIEFPGNTVSVMVPFNGTDEMQLNVTYSNGVDIGVMKLSSFQQWNASGLTTKAPFLPGSRTAVTVSSDPDAFSNWTVGGLSPQSSYVAVLQTESSASGRVAMSAYPGLPQNIDLLIPVRCLASVLHCSIAAVTTPQAIIAVCKTAYARLVSYCRVFDQDLHAYTMQRDVCCSQSGHETLVCMLHSTCTLCSTNESPKVDVQAITTLFVWPFLHNHDYPTRLSPAHCCCLLAISCLHHPVGHAPVVT